jgi:hypothetical protein
MTATAVAGARRLPWYRRKSVLVPGVVAAVLAVVVVTDLPQTSSRAAQLSNGDAVMSEVAQDIGPCSYALSESFTIYGDLARHSLTPSEESEVPGLLDDDQQACSFTSESIYDLSTIGVPGSASGRFLGQLVSTVTLWATSDALSAIEQIQVLVGSPRDAQALRVLAADEKSLASDRAEALAQLSSADAAVQGQFPALHLAQAPGG